MRIAVVPRVLCHAGTQPQVAGYHRALLSRAERVTQGDGAAGYGEPFRLRPAGRDFSATRR